MAGLVVSPLDSWKGQLLTPMFLKPQLPNHSLPLAWRQVRMMGGGPRTFPGGVTKWQWKRMQEQKSKQLLKARLLRERQLYEMRKRAELRAATANLEKPWEKPAKAPTLFAVTADEQLQALADRFQKPGGIDLWTEKDGPESLASDGKLSVRSATPYSRVNSIDADDARSSRSQQVSGSTPARHRYSSSSSNQHQSDKYSKVTRRARNNNDTQKSTDFTRRARNNNNTQKSTDFSTRRQINSLAGSNLVKNDDSYTSDVVYDIGSNSRHGKKRESKARPGKYSQNLWDSNARPGKYSQNLWDSNLTGKYSQNPRDLNASAGKYDKKQS